MSAPFAASVLLERTLPGVTTLLRLNRLQAGNALSLALQAQLSFHVSELEG